MDKYAAAFLEIPPGSVEVGSGGEMVPTSDIAEKNPALVETIRSAPDMVTARASIARINLIAETGDLDLAMDAADTIKAKNSLEKMLAHQIAAAHGLAINSLQNPIISSASLRRGTRLPDSKSRASKRHVWRTLRPA
jgi:hypothetical protein